MLKVVFMGTPGFAVPTLEALVEAGYKVVGVVTQPDRPSGRGKKVSFSPVKEKALSLGLSVFQPQKIKEISFLTQLTKLAPDLIVVAAFGKILPQDILDLPRYGCINVHASLLPRFRGAAPIHWAIMEGEKVTGVTTMLMDAGLDTGDMLLREEVAITPEMTGGQLYDLLAEVGGRLLVKTVNLWIEGKISVASQDHSAATYAPLLKREHESINWKLTAAKIHNQIRGLEPFPGAYTIYDGKPLKIREARIYQEIAREAEPGKVLEIFKGQGFVVQTGEGSLLVTKVQPEGKKVMTADSFVNGYHLEVDYAFNNSASE